MTQTYSEIFARLEAMLDERRQGDPKSSYVAKLYQRGSHKIAQKVGEEAVETAMAVAKGDRAEITTEAADLVFHLMVLLKAEGLSLADIADELARREGLSGLTEKASRREP